MSEGSLSKGGTITITLEEIAGIEAEAYRRGFKAGVTAYAWWKDGEQFVGTTWTLKEALEKADEVEEP